MGMTDPIADFLTRIRNGLHAGHPHVDIPRSKIKKEMTRILQAKGYIQKYALIDDGCQGLIRVYLKYDEDRNPSIRGLRRVSKPGRRIYSGSQVMPRVRNNLGIAIVSTPKGILTNLDARKANVGGEVLCYIW
jgi:small subunit ribosomal protein S8